MEKRIEELMKQTLSGKMFVEPMKTSYDRMDYFLSEQEKDVKRICEYIMNQQPLITKYSAFTGFFNFDDSVIGDAFHRYGHKKTEEFLSEFYCKHIDNLSSMDWQHGTSDYKRVLSVGMVGIVQDIEDSLTKHTVPKEVSFLKSLKKIAETFISWMQKCAVLASDYAKKVEDDDYRHNIEKLSTALWNISRGAPRDFYEAVLMIYVCFSLNPDSFGTLDRYLSDFYDNGIRNGTLTRDEAKAYLQELFLMVQSHTSIESYGFTRGGQSHFCVGGRDENGNDCFNAMSRLIVDSMMELDTHIPEVTIRWTSDMPHKTFRYLLKCERNDKNMRIAFTNDDKRMEAFTTVCGIPYNEAIHYTLVGCNEPCIVGGMCASTSHANLAHTIEWVMHHRSDEIINIKTFDDFYAIFEDQLHKDLDKIYYYDDMFNLYRSKDINYVSSLFMNGCIENAKSMTQGGVNYAVSTIMFLGNVTVMDSLAIVKQFVFDEEIVTMSQLINALKANWVGYEDLKIMIAKKGDFFGNDDETSNYVAKRYYDTLYAYIKDKKTLFGYPILLGDHTGYPLHFKWFGEATKATPDGRFDGEVLSYGIFQKDGRDRNGLTALMNAIAKFDPHGISGATVTNFTLDSAYVKNDEYFEKTVDMLETFFRNGGMQFQLNHVSCKELLEAKSTPEKYRNLKVRVTGYSDYFTRLEEVLQDSVIRRYGSEG